MTEEALQQRYQARVADVHDEADLIIKLWLAAYPELDATWARSKLEKQYIRNPVGEGACMFLEPAGQGDPVGVQGLIRRGFSLGDRELIAGNFVDYVVDPGHRSLGPALALLKATAAAGRETTDLLYAFPNRKSEVIFRRVGMKSPVNLTQFVRPLRGAHFLRQRLGGQWRPLRALLEAGADVALELECRLLNARFGRNWHWSEQGDFDEFFDRCWSGRRAAEWLVGQRTREMLRWRYPPGGDFRISVARNNGSGENEGYVIWQHGDHRVHVKDFFCVDPESQLVGLLAGFCQACRKLDVEAIALEFAGPSALRERILRAGFRDRGANPVFVWSERIPSLGLSNEALYMTSFDRDTD